MTKIYNSFLDIAGRSPVISAATGFLFVLLSVALASHSFLAFFSFEGLLIVGGGVVAAAFMSFEADDVKAALDAIVQVFRQPKMTHENLHRDITAIIYCARLLRQKGMRNLEAVIDKSGISDSFVKYGLTMVVSEYTAEEVRSMMETAADASYERESIPVDVLVSMSSHAPAFGMVGTLVGMVAMLCSLGNDLSNIGPSLAVAFLSTLYGVLSARMLYMPAASKLRQKVTNRRFRNYLITEGLVMLVSSKSPMFIQDRLNSFLKLETHDIHKVISGKVPGPELALAA